MHGARSAPDEVDKALRFTCWLWATVGFAKKLHKVGKIGNHEASLHGNGLSELETEQSTVSAARPARVIIAVPAAE